MRSSTAMLLGGAALIIAGVGAVFFLRRSPRRELEPHVAVVTREGRDEVLYAWMSAAPGVAAADRIALAFSPDGGNTVRSAGELRSAGGRFAADPNVVLAPSGDAYVTWLGFRANLVDGGDPYDMRVYLARSSAGAARLGEPREIAGGEERSEYDRPTATLDAKGRLLVAVRFELRGHAGIALLTVAGDSPPERRTLVEADGFGGGLPAICASVSSDVAYVTWFDPISGVHLLADAARASPATARRISLSQENVALEAPSCVARGDDLWLVYGIGAGPMDSGASASIASLVLLHSTDRGATFGEAKSFHDPTGPMVHPAVLGAANGGLTLLYYAGMGPRGALRRASLDREGNGAADTLRSDLPLALRRDNPAWAGDYIGFARAGDHEYAAFGEQRRGLPHVTLLRVR